MEKMLEADEFFGNIEGSMLSHAILKLIISQNAQANNTLPTSTGMWSVTVI